MERRVLSLKLVSGKQPIFPHIMAAGVDAVSNHGLAASMFLQINHAVEQRETVYSPFHVLNRII